MTRRVAEPLRRAAERFSRIDGAQWAGALAYSAFASLFPMILLFLTAASFLIDRDRAGRTIIGFMESYVPMSEEMRRLVFATISGMVEARGRAGAAAVLVLIWTASRGFSTLVEAANRAWDVPMMDWRRLPARSLALLGLVAAAAPVAMTGSALASLAARFLPYWANELENHFLPLAAQFLGLALFYRFAPLAQVRFGEVWIGAGVAALLLRAAENLFVIYLRDYSASNAVYGVFGGIMALLLWIYLSACVFIYGACLCAAERELAAPRSFAAPPQ